MIRGRGISIQFEIPVAKIFVASLLVVKAIFMVLPFGMVTLASQIIEPNLWNYVGCFNDDDTIRETLVSNAFTWSECRDKATEMSKKQFALSNRIGAKASCYVANDLTAAGSKSIDPCFELRDRDGHAYGGPHQIAVYKHINGTSRYLGCFQHNNLNLENHRDNMQIPGLVTWSECEESAIEFGKAEFVLKNKISSRATCIVGEDFTSKPRSAADRCTWQDSDSHKFGDLDELAVYEQSTTTTTKIVTSTPDTTKMFTSTTADRVDCCTMIPTSTSTITATKVNVAAPNDKTATITTVTTTAQTTTTTIAASTYSTTTTLVTTQSPYFRAGKPPTALSAMTTIKRTTAAAAATTKSTTTTTITFKKPMITRIPAIRKNARKIISNKTASTVAPSPGRESFPVLLGGIVIGGVLTVMVLIGTGGIYWCVKSKLNVLQEDEVAATDENPYHLAEYGLRRYLKADQLQDVLPHTKTFESSNFRVVKDALNKRLAQINGILPLRYITDAIRGLIQCYTKSSVHYSEIDRLMIETEMKIAETGEFAEDAGVKAEMFWSSAISIQGAELCSILNAAIRADDPHNIVHAVVFAKGIEMRRNMDRNNLADLTQKYPDKRATADMFPEGIFPECLEHENWLACFRGGGFNNKFRAFFDVGKYYRCPGFLATSTTIETAQKFIMMQSPRRTQKVSWTILLDGRGVEDAEFRCMHASFVSKSHKGGESEFLFSPYSVFQVVSTEWSSSRSKPHSIILRAAIDNMDHPEDLPLAPWY